MVAGGFSSLQEREPARLAAQGAIPGHEGPRWVTLRLQTDTCWSRRPGIRSLAACGALFRDLARKALGLRRLAAVRGFACRSTMSLASEVLARRMGLTRAWTRDVVCERDLRATMDDGAVLLADRYVARATCHRPQPTVLVHSPYGRRQLIGVILAKQLVAS